MRTNHTAERLANLTFNLLARCQVKEEWLATQRGLFQAEFKCLRLFGSDKSLNCKKIAKRMNLSQSRLTRIIDGLVTKGYMNREIDQTDRRNMRVSLSRRGKILTNKIDKDFIEIHEDILQNIDSSKHESLIKSMEQLLTATEKWRQ
ncbi:MAG: MarR family transcriptional regulator [Ignavibacterium sp.]|nr:MAG: MarR family transcriptional regulator [Ignavibacterium sp.]